MKEQDANQQLIKNKAIIDPALLTKEEAENKIIIHFCFDNRKLSTATIRIYRSTFLIDNQSGVRARLMHAENLTLAPTWTYVKPGNSWHGVLIFETLPANCTSFDFIEEIGNDKNPFLKRKIIRDKSDIYRLIFEVL